MKKTDLVAPLLLVVWISAACAPSVRALGLQPTQPKLAETPTQISAFQAATPQVIEATPTLKDPPRQPAPTPTLTLTQAGPDWSGILGPVLARGGEWHVLVQAQGRDRLFAQGEDSVIHPASVIKLAIGMLSAKWLEEAYGNIDAALTSGPYGVGRSYDQLLRAMLVYSEEDATQALQDDLVKNVGWKQIDAELAAWGAPHTTLVPRRSSANDIAALLDDVYFSKLPTENTSKLILGYLAEMSKGDDVRLWKLAGSLPQGAQIYNKRGSLTDPMIVADAGIIALPDGRAYTLVLFGYPDGNTTFEALDQTIGDFALAWYRGLVP